MRKPSRWATRTYQRTVVMLATVALATSVLTLVTAPTAAAATGTILFQNSFKNRTVNGTGTVTLPAPVGATNAACLTASGNSATLPVLSCASAPDRQGSGVLRLTNSSGYMVGGIFGATSFPSANGIDVTFNTYQWGGGGADGLAFVLAAVDPANPVAPGGIGPSGGSLGYTSFGSVNGLPNAYLGVGLDTFGNYSNTKGGFSGSGCAAVPTITGQTPGAMVVRGPGNGRAGYCGLTTTYNGTAGSQVTLRAGTRAASVVPVEVLINPTTAAFTSDSNVTVLAGTYKVVMTPVAGAERTLSGPLPVVQPGLYPSTSWLTAAGIPRQLAFGFIGSTGGTTDAHEVSDVQVITFNAVPQLAVSTTSYSLPTAVAGGPVNYSAVATVLSGADENSAISVTQTLPTGSVPVGAYGDGWVCDDPVGQTVSCTTAGSSFPSGTVLPAINIIGIVTAATLSAATVQNSSVTSVGSSDGNPGTDKVMAAGSVPAPPSSASVTPAIGPIAGGGSITLASTTTAVPTAIEIGTTAEQVAGKPVVLLPCVGGATVSCFNIVGNTVVIPSMPARATAATVSVTTVTLGVATAVNYVYADKPATPSAPTASAGVLSDTVSWVAPVANGSVITGYILTPYLNGVAQTAINYDANSTTKTLTGLSAGALYTYTIAATNAYGTSTASPKSSAVIPYTVPGAPVITAASAGDSQAKLTWSTPASTGSSPITGYVVTPIIGAVAQTPQTFNSAALSQTVTGLTPGTVYTFTVAAINAAGAGAASSTSGPVTPNVSPNITGTAPPAGEVGAAYTKTIIVTGGTSPYVWSLSSGTLPAGLTVNATTGVLSGTPTASGSFPVTVQVVDASNQSASASYTLVIAAAPVVTFAPPAGEVSIAYIAQPTVAGGTSAYTWALTGGSLPTGLALNTTTGQINGTPTANGSFAVTVSVTDSFGQVASQIGTIVIVALPTMTSVAPTNGQVGVAYSSPTFAVTGGTLPVTWSLSAGALPPGLSLAGATGVLSGTPATAGTYSFTVSAVDNNGLSTSKSVTLVVATGPLVITKTANTSSAVVGGTVLYTITIANSSSTTFTGVNLSDPLTGVLDDATYNVNAVASTGAVSYSASTLSWTGAVAGNATVTITYGVTINNPDTGNKVLSNTVSSATLGGNCAGGSTDTRCTATVTVAGLTIVKTSDVASTTPGGVVRFKVVVTNSGQSAYTGAAFTDTLAGVLDDATYNSDASATTGSATYGVGAVSWTGNLAVGASSTITYSVTVANPDNGDRSLTGAIVSASAGSSCPSGNAAASCSAVVTVLVPAMVIRNTSTITSATPGSVVPYQVTLSNTGQTAYTGTTVTLALAGALDDATYNNDAAASAGGVGFSGGTLTWTGDLAIGAVVTITASVTVNNPVAGNKILTTVVSSAAAGSTCPSGGANPDCTSTITVLIPALTITKSADVNTTTPGSVVRYLVSVTNSGQTAYTGATFSDPLIGALDDAVYNIDAAATAGAVSYAGSTLTWTGNLGIGATATITYSVTVKQPDPGDKILANTVSSTTAGSNCPSGSVDVRCTSSVTVLVPGLSFTTSVDNNTPAPGSVITYTVTALNTGQTAYTGATANLDLSGVTDDATYNGDAVTTSGSIDFNTGIWTFSVPPGARATIIASFTVNTPDNGDQLLKTVTTSNTAGSTCPSGSGNTACRTAVTVLIPGLLITKSANVSSVVTGGTVNYTVTVLNNGQTAYAAATFADSLAGVLTDATYAGGATATVGTITYAAQTLTWTGALAPGAASTITYSVTVRDPDPGDKLLTNTVVSGSPGSNCASGSADARCTALVLVLVPALTIVKSADVATAAPGSVVTFTIKVTNSGATAYPAATLTDSLAGVLDDSAISDVAATAGSAAVAVDTLNWTGPLAIGASATITYSATVKTAAGGDNRLTNTVVSTSSGSNCAPGSIDIRCTATVLIARLLITRTYGVASTTPGSTVTATAAFTNTGQVAYTGISVALDGSTISDDATRTGDQTASSGSLSLSGSTLTWSGNIPVGGVVTVIGSFVVNNPDTGDRSLGGTWVSTAAGNNCPAGGTDVRCTNAIPVLLPALTITKTANVGVVVPGGTVAYTITVVNNGQTAYTGAVVTDSLTGVLDDGAYNAGAATTTAGELSYASPTLTWTGDVAVGATVTINYTVTTFSPDTGDKTMINPVSSTVAGSSCLPGNGVAACRSTVVVLTPALTIVKSANSTSANLGATVTYTVTVTNSGQVPYGAATFNDSLAGVTDDGTYNAGATTASIGSTSYASGILSWTGAVPVGQVATVTYTVTVASPDTGDRSLANTVVSTSTGNNCDAASTDTRCRVTLPVINSTTLTLHKTADVSSTIAGGTVHYTATITNSSVTAVPASFTDGLAGLLDDAVYANDASASSGALTFNSPDLTWTGTVAAGATVSVTYSVTVRNPLAGNNLLTDTLISASAPGSNNCPSGSGDINCRSTVPVAALDLYQFANESTTTPGSVVHLTATYTNIGQVAYTGISVSSPRADTSDDTIPAGDQIASSGTLVRNATSLIWTGDIPVGGVVTITRTLTVQNPDPGNQRIAATLDSAAIGNNCPTGTTDPRCSFLITVLTPGLTINTTANTPATVPGGTVGYTVTVQNTGQTAYTGARFTDNLAGLLNDATFNNDAVATSGAVAFTSPNLSWTGDLAVGATTTITFSVTVLNPDPGDKTMVSSVSSTTAGNTCPVASGNAACTSTVLVLTPALTIVKSSNLSTVTLGSTVTYTVVVTNSGQTAYPAATFSDSLADVLDDAAYDGNAIALGGGNVNYSGNLLTWTGSLAVGAVVTITYSVTTNPTSTGNGSMSNTVVSTSAGSNCASGSADTRCSAVVAVVNAATLTFAKTADARSTVAGAVVRYTVTVTNASGAAVSGANFSDPLSGIIDDAAYNGNASASSGAVTYADSILSWSGTVAAGATVSVTYSVTVKTSAFGDQVLLGTVTSTSIPGSNNCLTSSTDLRCSSAVPIASLLIQQSYAEPSTTPGSVVHLSATFKNTGKFAYQGISISSPSADAVDDAIPAGDQTASSGSLVLTASAIVWTGDIPIGATITVAGTLTIKNPDPGDRVLSGTLVSAAPGNNCPSGTTDLRCTATVNVLLPGLTITKSTNVTTASPGDVVAYQIAVHNTGQTPYTQAVVTNSMTGVLDDATYNSDATTTSGSIAFAASTLTFTGDLPVGASATIAYSVTVKNPDPGDKSLVDLAVSNEVGSTCPSGVGTAACRSSVDVLTPGLTIVKTANLTTANLGTTVSYTVTVTNSGQIPYAPATFTDSLAGVTDDATYGADAAATSGTVTFNAGTIAWTGALTVGQVSTITYTVTVNSPDTGDQSLTNTVLSVATGNNCAPGSIDTRCTTSVSVINSPALTFDKSADVASTVAGAVVNYSVAVTNSSGAAVTDVAFSDSLIGVLDDAVLTSGPVATSGTPTYTEPTLSWTGTVAAGATVTITYSVTVRAPLAGDNRLTDTLVSGSPAVSNNCLAGSVDTRCRLTVPVASLTIEQHYLEASTTPGSLIHLTGTFTNTGQVPYTGISVTSPSAGVVDDAVPTGNQTATSGMLVLSATAITWTGNIPVGATITITGTLTVDNPDAGNRIITGTLSSAAAGSNCPSGSSDTRCTATILVLLPGLSVTTTADVTSLAPAGVAAYTVVIHNTGETAYTGAVVTDSLAGVVDDATYGGNATTSDGVLSFTSPTLTWTGDLALNATVTISFTVTANRPATGDKAMTNAVTSAAVGSSCPPAGGGAGCSTTVLVLTPSLSIVTTTDVATAVPGSVVTYTTLVTNNGETNYNNAAFSAPLAGVTDDATLNPDARATVGTVSVTPTSIAWASPLAIGATATIKYSVIVNDPAAGDHLLTQTLISTNQGTTCPAGGTDPRCSTSVPIAGLHILTVANRTTAQPTSVVVYTTTFTNTGAVPYFGISINADVAGANDDATYLGDATATAGSVAIAHGSPVVTWTGDLAVGTTVVLTLSVTVNNPDTGDHVITAVVTTAAPASNCPVGGSDAACQNTVTVLTPILTITKTVDATTATPGSTVNYTITAVNTGETDYTGAVVTDSLSGVLGDATFVGPAIASRGAVEYNAPRVTWTGDLLKGQTVVVSYSVRINNPDLGGKVMSNQVVSDEIGSTCPTGSTSVGCTTSVTVTVPALAIAISADSNTTTPGSAVGYTITIQNTGQTVYNGATVTAHLVGALDDAGYAGGATSDIGSTGFASPDLTWTGTLAIGATATVSYSMTVASPDPGNQSLTTTVTSPAPGSTCTVGAPCSSVVTVLTPGLAISTSASVATATPGDRVVYTTTLQNTGQTAYVGTTFSSSLAGVIDDATVGPVGATVGLATYTAPNLTWTGNLPIGATAVITYTATVRNPDPGDKTMIAAVVASATGSTCPSGSGNAACIAAVTVLVPALTISTTSPTPTTTPGSVVTLTVLLRNSGQTPYTGAVVADSLVGLLGDAVYNADAAVVGGGTLAYTDQILTWTGDLPIASSVTITFTVTVLSPDTGDKLMVNTVSSSAAGSSCLPGSTGSDCSANVQVLVPALGVLKTVDVSTVTAGSAVHYTITLTNTGQTAYEPATFTDPLGAVLDDAAWNGDAHATSGTLDFTNNTLAWSGPIPLAGTVTVTYSVTTRYPATGDRVLSNVVTSPSPGSNCILGTAARCRTSVAEFVPALSIVKTADATLIAAGGTVHYMIQATNTGQADYAAAAVTDSLADVVDDAVYNNDAVATVGTIGFDGGALNWSGPLARGASVQITYSVTTLVADEGNAVLTNRAQSSTTGSNCADSSDDSNCLATTTVAARSIALSGLTNSFTLTGLPNTTVTGNGLVNMLVTTNSTSGYTVTVQPDQDALVGAISGNLDTIPIGRLSVRASGTSVFKSLSGGPIVVHQQSGPSGPNGDAVSNDFQVQTPFVNADTYSGTLDYIVSAQ